MANLAGVTYLHSQRWNFFKQVSERGISDKDILLKDLENLLFEVTELSKKAKTKEREFYKDFDVHNNIEWAKKYLINVEQASNGGLKSREGAIIHVLTSKKMIHILSGQDVSAAQQMEAFKQEFFNAAENVISEQQMKIVEERFNQLQAQDLPLEEIFIDLIGFRSNKSKIKNRNHRQMIQKALWNNIKTKTKDSLKKTGKVYSIDSDYFRPYKAHLNKKYAGFQTDRIQGALDYFAQELPKYEYFKNNPNEIETFCQAFRFMLLKDMQDKEPRLSVTNVSVVTGETLEQGMILSQLDLQDPFEYDIKGNITNLKSKILSTAKDTKTRFGNNTDVKSKIDLIWKPTKKNPLNSYYNIQTKHSINQLYTDFEVMREIETLPEEAMSSIGLQANSIRLPTLMEGLRLSKLLDEDEVKFLAYLIVNMNVLNKEYTALDEEKSDRLKKGLNQNDPTRAKRTQELIDLLLTKGVKYFISDFPEPEDLTIMEPYDFIIFRGETLIPMSMIYDNILELLKTHSTTLDRIYTTTSTNFPEGQFNLMKEEKQRATALENSLAKANGKKVVYDYHLDDLVRVGSTYGKMAYDATKVNGVNFKFNYKNLIMKGINS